jgi:hypothetical protein
VAKKTIVDLLLPLLHYFQVGAGVGQMIPHLLHPVVVVERSYTPVGAFHILPTDYVVGVLPYLAVGVAYPTLLLLLLLLLLLRVLHLLMNEIVWYPEGVGVGHVHPTLHHCQILPVGVEVRLSVP